MKLICRILTVVLLSLLLAACGVRSAYNNLDWLILRWINNQVSLSEEQRLAARQSINAQLRWHCRTELPDYVAFLYELNEDIEEGRMDAERLFAHGQKLAEFGRRFVDAAQPGIIELLASLDDAQVEELKAGFAESNAEMEQDLAELSPTERQAQQVRGMERGMRRFVGRLTAEQRRRLEQWAAEFEPGAELTLAQRQAWQERFFATMARRDNNGLFETQMSALLEPGADWSEHYRELMERNRERTIAALADIHRLAPAAQIQRLQSRINTLARDFERLSCSA